MKTVAQRILEYLGKDEEIGWIASDNCGFSFVLCIPSNERGRPHINVYSKDSSFRGKIAIPDSSPSSADDIVPILGEFSDSEKNLLAKILSTKVDTGTPRWELASIIWSVFNGEM